MIIKFLIKAFLLALLVVCSCLLYLYIAKPLTRNSNEYVAVSIDKEQRLATLPSPKLIFTGGSNLNFGLDCEKISKSFNLPVVNMGLHAGLGLTFILNETKDGIKKGDIIILSTEYFLADGNRKLQSQVMDINPQAAKYFTQFTNKKDTSANNNFIESANEKARFFTSDCQRCTSSLFYKSLRSFITGFMQTPYQRKYFSKEGDMIGHLNMPQPKLVFGKKLVMFDYSKRIEEMNAFAAYASNKGAVVYYAFPNYPETAYRVNKDAIENFTSQLKAKLNITIINTPETFLYPDKYFFDLTYHLNREGREIRTNGMIELLKERVR